MKSRNRAAAARPEINIPANQVPHRCERCHHGVPYHRSMFNPQWICADCERRESNHPQFFAARREVETRAMRHDFNFDGVGLPPELDPAQPHEPTGD